VARAKPLTNHLAATVLPHRFENAKTAGQRRKVNFRAGTTTRYSDGNNGQSESCGVGLVTAAWFGVSLIRITNHE
jgi:hypothetical protein